jgi:hypothetical protein
VADVVALELEARALGAELGHDPLHVLEGVLEDEVARVLQVGRLPVVAELLDAARHRVQAEVHAAHVQRTQLGPEAAGGGEALVQRHPVAAARGDVDHHVAARRDLRQELGVDVGVGRGAAVLRIAGVQVHDGRSGVRGADRAVRDLAGRDREVGRQRRDVDRAGDGAADDDLVGGSHLVILLGRPAKGLPREIPF